MKNYSISEKILTVAFFLLSVAMLVIAGIAAFSNNKF
jgi:hypothetical protein